MTEALRGHFPAARDLAIGHYKSFATMMKLEITVLDSQDSGAE